MKKRWSNYSFYLLQEEKEDGELDDENDDNNSQQNYDDDYDDYDFDEDSKNSRENEEVNSNGNKKSPAVVEAFNSDGKPTVGNATKDSSPVESKLLLFFQLDYIQLDYTE